MSESSGKQYIKFMSDIIDSGLWGKLSPAAKTLYPVLLKFSDQNFKHVWPSTDTLLKLTGFKTKKSIMLGKKELIKEGLLHYKPGSGRTNSTYYFSFNYEGSKITPQWNNLAPLTEVKHSPSEGASLPHQSITSLPPNNLNITINNNNNSKPEVNQVSYEILLDTYGVDVVESAFQIAKEKGLESNLSYFSGICKNISNKKIDTKHERDNAQHVIDSWKNFIDWSRSHLTKSSAEVLESISVDVDGQSIFIKQVLSEFLKQIILKYFKEQVFPPLFVTFATNSEPATYDRSKY